MTPRQVALKFAVTPNTVTKWVREGKLRAFTTPGGRVRFHRSDVEAFIAPQDSGARRRASDRSAI